MDIFCLFRFGEKRYVENFLKKGEIRFSPIKKFRDSPDKERSDELEGATHIVNGGFFKMEIEHPILGKRSFDIATDTASRLVHYDGRFIGSFSTYAITSKILGGKDSLFIDERVKEFGDYALVIPSHNFDEYFSRLRSALDATGLKYGYGYVSYTDLAAPGDVKPDIFTKGLNFAHQSEHRVVVVLEKDEPLFINIGSLEDIALTTSTESWLTTEFKITKRKNGK